jgi:hypothetical protein
MLLLVADPEKFLLAQVTLNRCAQDPNLGWLPALIPAIGVFPLAAMTVSSKGDSLVASETVAPGIHKIQYGTTIVLAQSTIIAVAFLFRTFLWTRSARPQKCPRPNRSGGCYTLPTPNFLS